MGFSPQTADLNPPTIEERVERIERLLSKIIEVAKAHPMGRMLIDTLGL